MAALLGQQQTCARDGARPSYRLRLLRWSTSHFPLVSQVGSGRDQGFDPDRRIAPALLLLLLLLSSVSSRRRALPRRLPATTQRSGVEQLVLAAVLGDDNFTWPLATLYVVMLC